MTYIESKIEMRPVGQGAFIRGEVAISSPGHYHSRTKVRWIYDCGTEASKSVIDASVHDLSDTWPSPKPSRAELDILVLSHFDKDHISGLPVLLSRYKFKRIFMPHLPRLVRLVAILQSLPDESFEQSAELIELADDPIQFFRARGGETAELIFVEPAKEEPPDQDEITDRNPERPFGDMRSQDYPELTHQRFGAGVSRTTVYLISSGTPVTYANAWELIPYIDRDASATLAFNDIDHADLASALDDIRKAQENHSLAENNELKARAAVIDAENALSASRSHAEKALRTRTDNAWSIEGKALANAVKSAEASAKLAKKEIGVRKEQIEAAIEKLKSDVYEKMAAAKAAKKSQKAPTTSIKASKTARSDRGKLNAKEKNAISLMIYMGAICPRVSLVQANVAVQILCDEDILEERSGQVANGNGVLLTGDANLKGASAVDALVRHIKRFRVNSLGVFQVPHHGSTYNSDTHTAQELAAPFNAFNANPFGKHQHPDLDVIKIFSNYTPAHALTAAPLAILANARPFVATIVSADRAASAAFIENFAYRHHTEWSLD